jgi:glutathione S-transferase
MLELYQAEWCPHSRRVRLRLTELGLDFVARNVEAQPEDRQAMRERTGLDSIPVLLAEDGEAIGEADRILDWLDEHHAETPETSRQRAQIRAHGLEPTQRPG